MSSFSSKKVAQHRPLTTGGSSSHRSHAERGERVDREREIQLSEDQRHEMSEAFELFSIQSPGVLNYHELKVGLRALGWDLKKAEVHKIIKDYSQDGKSINQVNFNQYGMYLSSLHSQTDWD